jgi:hypothetical protein
MMPAQTEIPDPRVTPTVAVEHAGQILGMGRAAAYAAVQRGEIPVLRFGRRIVVPTAKLLAMLGLGGDQ